MFRYCHMRAVVSEWVFTVFGLWWCAHNVWCKKRPPRLVEQLSSWSRHLVDWTERGGGVTVKFVVGRVAGDFRLHLPI